MTYKILITVCLLILSACDTKYSDETAHAKSVEQQKIENPKSNLSSRENSQRNKDIKKALDNKIYVLLDSKEGCVVSEKPLNNDIVII